ncbi:MAG: hypothetical protein RQ856_05080 [Candidatus Izemoplasmatales bacterium]|nr:hypothetical protein [Candidatus Izemoplasmatales bacterium]
MKKRITFLFLLGFISLLLIGCGGNTDITIPTSTTTQSNATTTLAPTTTAQTTTQSTSQNTITTIQEFNVTFLNWDGTVIETQNVPLGGNASPPITPTKPATYDFVYIFVGWDKTLTNITANTTFQAQFEVRYNSQIAYSHPAMLAMVSQLTGSEDPLDIEADLTMMMNMTEVATEEELFYMLTGVMSLAVDVQRMNSAADIQYLLDKILLLGLDADMVSRIVFTMMYQGLENDIIYMTEDISYFETEIIDIIAYIAQLEADASQMIANAYSYCDTTDYVTLCQTYIQNSIDYLDAQKAYHDYENSDVFYTGEYYFGDLSPLYEAKSNYVYNRDLYLDIIAAQGYLDQYNLLLAEYGTEEQIILTQLMNLYEDYLVEEIQLYHLNTYNDLYNLDSNNNAIIEVLNDYIFEGYYDSINDVYYESYQSLLNQIENQYYLLYVLEDDLNKTTERLSQTTELYDYLTVEANADKVRAMIAVLYDAIFATTGEIDQEMINIISALMSGDQQFLVETLFVPGNLTYAVNKLGAILYAFEDTLSEEDYLLMTTLIKDILPIMIMPNDLTPEQEIEFISVFNDIVDQYITVLRLTGDDLIDFMLTFDDVKANQVLKIIGLVMMQTENDDQKAYNIAVSLEVLFGDDSFDVKRLILDTIDVYYLASQGLEVDPLVVQATKTQVGSNIDQILLLAQTISTFDNNALTQADLKVINEFMAWSQNLFTGYDQGFTNLLTSYSYTFSSTDFTELLYRMGFQDTAQVKTDLMALLGETDEEIAYYKLRSLCFYLDNLPTLRSFFDVKTWLGDIESFGLTQNQVVSVGVYFLELQLQRTIDNDWYYHNQLDMFQSDIDYYYQEMLNSQVELEAIAISFDNYRLTLDIAYQDVVYDYWNALIFENTFNIEYQNQRYNLEWWIVYSDIALFETAYYNLYQAGNAVPFDQAAYDQALLDLNNLYAIYSYDQAIIDQINYFLNAYEIYFVHNEDVYIPAQEAFYATITDPTVLYNVQNEISNHLSMYLNEWYNYDYVSNNYYHYLQAYDNLASKYDDLYLLIDTIANNRALVIDMVNVMVDEARYMVANTPDDAFAEIDELIIFALSRHGNYPDFTSTDILALLQDFSAIMKLRGTTIDAADEIIIGDFAEVVAGFMADQNMMVDPERAEFITAMSTALLKYRGFADFTLTEIIDLIDNLDQTDVDLLVNNIHAAYSSISDMERVVLISQIVDTIVNVPEFDYNGIMHNGLEVYFDLTYEFQDKSIELASVQAAFDVFMTDTFGLIGTVAIIDRTNMTPANIAAILEVQDRVMYFFSTLVYPEGILDGYTYEYTHAAFADLLIYHFGVPELDVDAYIASITTGLGMTEEEAYYQFMAIVSVLRNLEYVTDVSQVTQIFGAMHNIGLTNPEIADFLMLLFMEFEYEDLPFTVIGADLTLGNALYNYLSLETNVTLTKEVLVILLDELEALMASGNLEEIQSLIMLFEEFKYYNPSPEDIALQLNNIGASIGLTFSTIDEADMLKITQMLNGFLDSLLAERGVTDPIAILAIKTAMLENLSGLMDLPSNLSAFLTGIDVYDVGVFMNILYKFQYVSYEPDGVMQEAIIQAQLINMILNEEGFDEAYLLENIYLVMNNINFILGYQTTLPTTQEINDLLADLDTFILQTQVVTNMEMFNFTNDIPITTWQTLLDDLLLYIK